MTRTELDKERHRLRMLAALESQMPSEGDLEALGCISGQEAVDMAKSLGETHQEFAEEVSRAVWTAQRERTGTCKWPSWIIAQAMLRSMEGVSE